MLSWNAIFADLEHEPVRGQPESYATAADHLHRQFEVSDTVARLFDRVVSSGPLAELRGTAIDRLVQLINGLDESLNKVPPAFADARRVMLEHDRQLVSLQQQAQVALGTANDRRDEALCARESLAQTVDALHLVESQLERLRARTPDPFTFDLIERLEADRMWRCHDVETRHRGVEWADDQLGLSRLAHERLAADEHALIALTIAAVRRTSMGDICSTNDVQLAGNDLLPSSEAFTSTASNAHLLDVLDVLASGSIDAQLEALAVALHATMVGLVAGGAGARAVQSWGNLGLGVGDRDGTYSARVSTEEGRRHLTPHGTTATARALDTILQTLAHTGEQRQIWRDEFEIVKVNANQYMVVLPGVTDLSNPQFGLDPNNRTVRDIDQFAVRSAQSTGMGDNVYAQMVQQALAVNGVPIGADIMLVGHSFGADTALDLAADPRFNGPGAYNVTHAVVAGYHSGPQIVHVPARTEVLALHNTEDIPVRIEQIGNPVLRGVDLIQGGFERVIFGDPFGGIPTMFTGAATVARIDIGSAAPGVQEFGDRQHLVVFEGGTDGRGHHQTNYISYLKTTDEIAVTSFAASVALAGYARGGNVTAIDISVPRAS